MRATPVWRGALTYDSLHSRLVTHARCIEMFHLSIMFIVVIQHHYRLIYPNLRLRNVVWLHFFMHKSSFTAQFWCILAAIRIILVADPDCRAHIVSHIPSVLRGLRGMREALRGQMEEEMPGKKVYPQFSNILCGLCLPQSYWVTD